MKKYLPFLYSFGRVAGLAFLGQLALSTTAITWQVVISAAIGGVETALKAKFPNLP